MDNPEMYQGELLSNPHFNIDEVIQSDALNDKLKNQILKTYSQEAEKNRSFLSGLMGRLFGNSPSHISMYIAFIISVLLILVGLIYILIEPDYKVNTNVEFWQIIGPIITGALGFIFGKGTK